MKNPAFGKSSFARRPKRLIKELLLLKRQKPTMKADEYQRNGQRLEERLQELSQQNLPIFETFKELLMAA